MLTVEYVGAGDGIPYATAQPDAAQLPPSQVGDQTAHDAASFMPRFTCCNTSHRGVKIEIRTTAMDQIKLLCVNKRISTISPFPGREHPCRRNGGRGEVRAIYCTCIIALLELSVEARLGLNNS